MRNKFCKRKFAFFLFGIFFCTALFGQSVTKEFAKTPLGNVLKEIERQTGLSVVYDKKDIDGAKLITRTFKDTPVAAVLSAVLDESMDFSIHNKMVVIHQKEQAPQQKALKTVSGIVFDDNGEPVIGASIAEKGTTNGTITDVDGKFSLNISGNAVLKISFIGYLSQEMAVGDQTSLKITLREDAHALNEVVVVGYGTQLKSDLISAIAKVSGDALEVRQVSRLDQALQGQMAGVHVQQSGGMPGKKAVIRVRGVGSISAGNDPLYVVDGFPVDAEVFSNMSLSDIESVEVLKDAASASIYGSRGAGGVVIVTTKRGAKGRELKVSFDASSGVSNIERYISSLSASEHLLFLADARDDAYLRNTPGANLNVRPIDRPWDYRYDGDLVNLAKTNPSAIPEYNPVGELLRTGVNQNYQLSLAGSTPNARYMISGNYYNEEGIVKRTYYTRYSFRANIDVDVNKWLTVGMSLAPAYITGQDMNTEGKDNVFSNATLAPKWIEPRTGYWIVGSGPLNPITEYPIRAYYGSAVLSLVEHLKDERKRGQVLADMYGQIKIMEGLNFKSSFGAVYVSSRRDTFSDQTLVQTGTPLGSYTGDQSLNILNENILNFDRTFASVHHLSAIAGFTVQTQKNHSAYLSGTNFANDMVPTLNAAGAWTGSTSESENSMLSYLGRVNYAYADRYLLSASIRNDGSSRFGANTKWGLFPSVSAGWRVEQEEFFKPVTTIIDRLKLRASWGKTGNDNIGNYNSIPTLGNTTYPFGMSENLTIGMYPSGIANPNLGWEKTATIDIGVDLSFLNSKLSLTVDYYNSKTSDLLLNVPVPTITGFGSELQNIGEVENKGWEFEISSINISNRDFRWSTSLNLSFNENKVLKLGPNDAPIIGGDWYDEVCLTTVGKPIGSYYVYKQLGVYKNQAEVDADPARRSNTRPGDIIIEDYNHDGQITPDDRQIFGSNIPKYHFGLTNRFSYRGIDLSIFINGVGGNQIFNTIARLAGRGNYEYMNHYGYLAERWRSPEEPGNGWVARASQSMTGMNGEFHNHNIYDGAYVRLKNITLGYTFPKQWTKWARISDLRVYVNADNLYIWDHYDVGYTPEVDLANGNATAGGRDYGVYPSVRKFLFGLNVSF